MKICDVCNNTVPDLIKMTFSITDILELSAPFDLCRECSDILDTVLTEAESEVIAFRKETYICVWHNFLAEQRYKKGEGK